MTHLILGLGGLSLAALILLALLHQCSSGSPAGTTFSNISASELNEDVEDPGLRRFSFEQSPAARKDDRRQTGAGVEPSESEEEEIERYREKKKRFREQEADSRGYQTVMVQAGETLWRLAERTLGDGSLWPEIVRANGGRVRRDIDLEPGMELRIPTWLAEEPP